MEAEKVAAEFKRLVRGLGGEELDTSGIIPRGVRRVCQRCGNVLSIRSVNRYCMGSDLCMKLHKADRNSLDKIKRRLSGGGPRGYGERSDNWMGGRFVFCSICLRPAGWRCPSHLRISNRFYCAEHNPKNKRDRETCGREVPCSVAGCTVSAGWRSPAKLRGRKRFYCAEHNPWRKQKREVSCSAPGCTASAGWKRPSQLREHKRFYCAEHHPNRKQGREVSCSVPGCTASAGWRPPSTLRKFKRFFCAEHNPKRKRVGSDSQSERK